MTTYTYWKNSYEMKSRTFSDTEKYTILLNFRIYKNIFKKSFICNIFSTYKIENLQHFLNNYPVLPSLERDMLYSHGIVENLNFLQFLYHDQENRRICKHNMSMVARLKSKRKE